MATPDRDCKTTCRDVLIASYADLGVEATVTLTPPLVTSAYEPLNMRCPHGRVWYAEPTGEQIAKWAADGVG